MLCMKPGKGREIQIFLTPKGKEFVKEKIIPVIDMENSIFAQMTSAERNTLLQLTEKYLTYFREKVKNCHEINR